MCVEEGLLKYRIGKRLVDTPLEEGEPPCSDPFTCTATSGKPGEVCAAGPGGRCRGP